MPKVERREDGMLQDGSNPECTEPVPALNWRDAEDLQNVVVWGHWWSPPSSKIRSYLTYFDIPFEFKVGLNKPGTPYKKIPVVDVGGRQVNDSFVILKNLIPALLDSFDEDFEAECTYHFMLSVEDEICKDVSEVRAWMREPHGLGVPNCLMPCVAPLLTSAILRPELTSAFDSVPKAKRIDPVEWLKAFASEIGSNDFHGGARPSQKDLSIYGCTAPFMHKKVPKVCAMFEDAGLQAWWERMANLIRVSKLYPKLDD